MMRKTIKIYIFYLSLDDVESHSTTQLYEKSKTLVFRILANLSIDLDDVQDVATTSWLIEDLALVVLHEVSEHL